MTRPDDRLTPQGNAPAWTNQPAAHAAPPSLGRAPMTSAASSRADMDTLRLPDEPPVLPAPTFDADIWVTQMVGPQLDAWGEPLPAEWQTTGSLGGPPEVPERTADVPAALQRAAPVAVMPLRAQPELNLTDADLSQVAHKRLIAGLLAIFLGGLGAHKFYLGQTTPGLVLLGLNVGSWVMVFVMFILTLLVGLLVALPLAVLVTGALGLFGLVEGLILLTKSDEAFACEYLLERRPWL